MTTAKTIDPRPAVRPGATAVGSDPAAPLPLTRLTMVELRKLADTRAGLWLLVAVLLGGLTTAVVLLTAGAPAEQTFVQFFTFGLLPAGVLLPVLGILSMTGEWSQRTALTTFALVPVRGRVIAAKLAAAVLIAVAATATAGVIAVAGNLAAVATGGDGSWTIGAGLLARATLMQVIFVLMGSGFGALLLNSPLAIVLFFALPTVWSLLGEMVRPLHTAAGWLDLNATAGPLTEAHMAGGQWGRLATSVAVWVLLPIACGAVRVLRTEVS